MRESGIEATTSAHAGRASAMLGAVLLLAFAMNMLGRGATEVFAVFLLPVEKALGASRSQITGAYSLFMLVIGLSGPMAGYVFDRLGARTSYCSGLVTLGISLMLAGSANAVWHYYITVGAMAGLGVTLLGMVSANALLSRWYQARLGTAIGITYAASGCGVLVMAPLAQILIDSFGWRSAYRLIGAALLFITVFTTLLPLSRMWRGSSDWQKRRAVRSARPAAGPSLARRARNRSGPCSSSIC